MKCVHVQESLAVERIRGKIGGRKMRKKVSSSSHNNSVGKRKGDDLMAFASDYHPPKPHPPKNNWLTHHPERRERERAINFSPAIYWSTSQRLIN